MIPQTEQARNISSQTIGGLISKTHCNHLSWNQKLLKKPPHPIVPHASLKRFSRQREPMRFQKWVNSIPFRWKLAPPVRASLKFSVEVHTEWCNCLILCATSRIFLRKFSPVRILFVSKPFLPIKLDRSLFVTLVRPQKTINLFSISTILPAERLIVLLMLSSWIPKTVVIVASPSFFSCARGTPKNEHYLVNNFNAASQTNELGGRHRKNRPYSAGCRWNVREIAYSVLETLITN